MPRERNRPKPNQTFTRLSQVDRVTRRMIKNRSDELAALNGCWFDEERAEHVEKWMFDNLVIYEGDKAGMPFILGDWQADCIPAMFGWVRYDAEWTEIKRVDGTISVGEWIVIRRFNQAVIFIAKKNGKSPTLASVGLYLFAGDGEPGASVNFFAKDGSQVRQIVGRHAVMMYRSSPRLVRECKENMNLMELTHRPTNSVLRPASSGDERTKKSKEGINGNILVDEVHVVDADLMDRVTRAGISRMEPFQIEVSTAGDDPDSYGKSRFDYAQSVIDGAVVDQRLFARIYAAPQDLSPEEFKKDPVKYFRMANPAAGRLVRESEFMEDFNTSVSKGLHEIMVLMMYRCNVWLRGATKMIDPKHWANGRSSFDISDLYGYGGGVGADISKSNDMCSVVFTVKRLFSGFDQEVYLQYPFFFISEDYAQSHKHLVKGFVEWGDTGDLIIVKGSRIRDEIILDTVLPHFRLIKPSMIVYDETFANDIAYKMQDELGEKACDIDPRSQTHASYTEPTQEWLDDLKEGLILHPGNAVMDWQAGHVLLDRRDKLQKPIRHKKHRHQKIDGIQAAIMSHLAVRRAPVKKSVYNDRGVPVI